MAKAGSKALKRTMRVDYEAKGAAKLERQVNKVGDTMAKAGAKGAAGMKGADAATASMSKSMEDALNPIDKSFAGFDRLNSIIGKVSMVAGLAVLVWEAGSAALEQYNVASREAAKIADEQKKSIDALTGAFTAYAGTLASVVILEVIQANAEFKRLLAETVTEGDRLVRFRKEAEKARRKVEETEEIFVLSAIRLDKDATKVNEAKHRTVVKFMKKYREELKAADISVKNSITRTQSYDDALDAAKETISLLTTTTADATTTTKALGAATQDVEVSMDAAAAAAAMALEAQFALGDVWAQGAAEAQREADAVADLATQLDKAAAASERMAAAAAKQSAAVRRATKAADDRPMAEFTEGVKAGADAMLKSSVAAAVMGESIGDVLKSQIQALAIEASFQTIKSLALAAGAWGLGSPAAAAKHVEAAGLWGALAGASLGASAVVGAPGGGGGGAGAGSGASATTDDLTGPTTGSSGGAGGPVVVNLNFSGPASGLGRVIAGALNTEARTPGGARVDSRAVRGARR